MVTYGDAKDILRVILVRSIKYARKAFEGEDRNLRKSLQNEGDVYETNSLRHGRQKMALINQILIDALEAVEEGVHDEKPLPQVEKIDEIRGRFFKAHYIGVNLARNPNRVSHRPTINGQYETWVDSDPLSGEEAVDALCKVLDTHKIFRESTDAGELLTYMGVRLQSSDMIRTMGPNEMVRLLRDSIGCHINKGSMSSLHSVLSKVNRCQRAKIRLFFSMGGGMSIKGSGQFYYALGHVWHQYGRKGCEDEIEYVLLIGDRAKYIPKIHEPPRQFVAPPSVVGPTKKSKQNLERARAKGRRRKRRS